MNTFFMFQQHWKHISKLTNVQRLSDKEQTKNPDHLHFWKIS